MRPGASSDKLPQSTHKRHYEGTAMVQPDSLAGMIGYAVAAVAVGWQTYKKYSSEQRGESREVDRLLNALADERGVNAELRRQRDEAWEMRDEMFRELADLKASNARMEAQIEHLTARIEYLRFKNDPDT